MIFRSRLLFLLCFSLGLASTAWSQELEKQMLVDILSEPEGNLHHQLILHLDAEGDIQQISRVSTQSEQIFTIDDLMSKEVVLAQSSGLDAVLLHCSACDPNAGGDLVLKYIYNGITKTYHEFNMRIQRDGHLWSLTTDEGSVIHALTLKSRTVFGTVVGIKEIGVNEYQPEGMFIGQRTNLQPHEWNELVPGGDTICARGDAYKFYVNPGTTENLIIDFVGGGACWDYDTCNKATATFNDSINLKEMEKAGLDGLYDRSLSSNPFREWNHVLVPYCTGDIHWGNSKVTYTKGNQSFDIHHKGAINAQTVIRWAKETFPNAKNILVTGTSAGSYGSVYWMPQIRESFPTARVTQMGDSGVGIISQDFKMKYFPRWNPFQFAPRWIPELDITADEWNRMDLTDIYAAVGRYYPDSNLGQYTSVADDNQVFFYEVMGGQGGVETWTDSMYASIHKIRDSIPNFNYYIGSGAEHCILYQKFFYNMKVQDTAFVDWLWQIANRDTISQIE